MKTTKSKKVAKPITKSAKVSKTKEIKKVSKQEVEKILEPKKTVFSRYSNPELNKPSKHVEPKVKETKKVQPVENAATVEEEIEETPVEKTKPKDGEVAADGSYYEEGIQYNKHGICLACNGGNLECDHANLREEDGGKIVCNNCGETIL